MSAMQVRILPPKPMMNHFDIHGITSSRYGKACEICNDSIASCEEVHLVGDLCTSCEQAVKWAREQIASLKK